MKIFRDRIIQNCLIISVLLCGLFLGCQSPSGQPAGWNRVPEILNNIHPPQFAQKDFLISDFQAVGDGQTDCTEAFRQAIETCSGAGGGRVVVPEGIYLTGAIHLKSNVNLHIAENATILFSQDTRHYLPVVYTRFEGVECMNYSPFIYAFEQSNIAITGRGTLDGQADEETWWPWALPGVCPIQKKDRDNLFHMGDENVPVEQRVFGEGHFIRPNFIQFYRCKNILIEDVSIRRSPMWEIHPVLCENVTVRGVDIMSHGPNNDGCNPESSKNVLIKNCHFDTGDDCIAIKSGRNGDGRRINTPSENIIIQDCTMKDGHGGVVLGSEITGGCRNVYAENCTMDSPNLERALRIKTNSLRGGIVENIYMRNVRIGQVSDAILRVNFNYENGDAGQYTPVVRNIYMKHIISQKSNYVLMLDGYERSPITHVQLDSCNFEGVSYGNVLNHTDRIELNHVWINGQLQE